MTAVEVKKVLRGAGASRIARGECAGSGNTDETQWLDVVQYFFLFFLYKLAVVRLFSSLLYSFM